MTSVARLMPSTSEWRQPYLLSNLLLVTESLTLIAGKSSEPSLNRSYRRQHAGGRLLGDALDAVRDGGPALRVVLERTGQDAQHLLVLLVVGASPATGTAPAFSNSTPLWTSSVMSPPSSSSMFGPIRLPSSSVKSKTFSASSQYSASVSPFQANTGVPCGSSTVPFGPTTTAAAAWSWVEKMLQVAQRTSAPSATSVSIRTAVWIVMCSEPAMRAPFSGWLAP